MKLQTLATATAKATSFIEVQDSFKVQFTHPKFQAMINVLSEMMSSGIVSDQKMVSKILDIIDNLLKELRTEIKLLTKMHEQKIDDLST